MYTLALAKAMRDLAAGNELTAEMNVVAKLDEIPDAQSLIKASATTVLVTAIHLFPYIAGSIMQLSTPTAERLAGESEEHAHITTIYLEKSGILWKDTAIAAWFRRCY